MTITVEGPNGIIVDFPDGTDPGTIHGAMLQATGGQPARSSFNERFGAGPTARETQAKFGDYATDLHADISPTAELGRALTQRADQRLIGPDSAVNTASSAVLNAGDLLSAGLIKNAGAGIASALGGRAFAENLQLAKDQQAALSRQSPRAADIGTLGGGVAGLALPVASALSKATFAGRAGNAALTGAGYGAVSSIADEGLNKLAQPMDALATMAKGAGFGALGGTVLHGAVEGAFAGRARLAAPPAPAALPPPANPDLLAPAVREAEARRFGIDLSRGQATGDYGQQSYEAMTARAGAGEGSSPDARMLRDFFQQQQEQVSAAKGGVGRQLAGGEGLVERPYDAAAQVAERARATQQLADTVAAGHEEAATRASSGLAPVNPVNAGEAVAQGVRDQAAAARAGFQARYAEAAAQPGAFEPGAFQNLGRSVHARLTVGDNPLPVMSGLTPMADRALGLMHEAPPAGASMREVDTFRKRLVAMRNGTARDNNTDRTAMDQVIHHFDNHVEDALAGGLFSGSDQALNAYRAARAEFRQYQQTFRPQGPGDTVGQDMRRIVERDAQPQEVANLIYGRGVAGETSRAMRLADRLQRVLPADLWQQTQRGYIGRVIGDSGDHGRIIDNIQRALSGEGRGLTYRMLGDEQVAGLRSIQRGLQAARASREAVPEWIQQLGRSGFEPQAVAQNLFGKAAPGGVSSIGYARGVRNLVGENSPEWAAIRQAGWQHLTSKPEGATADFGPQALANRIVSFLEKDGRGLAQTLYSPEERQTMRAFAGVMRTLTPARVAGGSASPNSDTAPMIQRTLETMARHQGRINMLLGAVGFVKGGLPGVAAGYGIARAAQGAAESMAARQALRRAQEAISGAPAR